MASYVTIVSSRLTAPDGPALLAAVRAAVDPAAGVVQRTPTDYVVKTPAPLTAPQLAAAKNAIDTAPAASPQLTAQDWIDRMPIAEKAILLALIDQLNVIRAALPVPKPPITPAQAIQAARDKAGAL